MSNQRKTGQGTRKGSTSKNTSSRAKTSKTIDNTYTKKRKEAAVKALSPEESSRRMEIYLFIYFLFVIKININKNKTAIIAPTNGPVE